MTIAGRIGIFFGLVIGIPIMIGMFGWVFQWILFNHEDLVKKAGKIIEVTFFILLYLAFCALIAFGINWH